MRPRGIAVGAPASDASMRPRGSPRGIEYRADRFAVRDPCFNEAAGKSPRNPGIAGGRPRGSSRFNEAAGKSPRNADRTWRSFNEAAGKSPRNPGAPSGRFNEAAGKSPDSARGLSRGSFNEAAGKSPRKHERDEVASMRPRGSPRGIGPLVTDCGPRCWLPECERSGGCCARAATAAALSRDHSLQLSSCQRVAGVRALPGGATALERSRHGGGRCHTMTGSRRTA